MTYRPIYIGSSAYRYRYIGFADIAHIGRYQYANPAIMSDHRSTAESEITLPLATAKAQPIRGDSQHFHVKKISRFDPMHFLPLPSWNKLHCSLIKPTHASQILTIIFPHTACSLHIPQTRTCIYIILNHWKLCFNWFKNLRWPPKNGPVFFLTLHAQSVPCACKETRQYLGIVWLWHRWPRSLGWMLWNAMRKFRTFSHAVQRVPCSLFMPLTYVEIHQNFGPLEGQFLSNSGLALHARFRPFITVNSDHGSSGLL